MYYLNVLILIIFCASVALQLPSKWFLLKRITFSILFVFSLNTVLAYLAYLFNFKTFSIFYFLIYLFLSFLFLLKSLKYDKLKIRTFIRWSKKDTALLILGLTLLLLLMRPAFSKDKKNFIPLTPPGGDMTNHFYLINAISQKGTYIYLNKYYAAKMPKALTEYPQGAHINFAIINGSSGNNNSVKTLLEFKFYYLLSFVILFLSTFILAIETLDKYLVRPSIMQYFAAGSVLLFIFMGSVFSTIYLNGFISQFLALALLMVLVDTYVNHYDFNSHKNIYFIILVIINAGIANTWYFLLPVSLTIAYLGIYKKNDRVISVQSILLFLLCIPVVALSFLGGGASLNSVINSGEIGILPSEYIAISIIFFVTVIFFNRKKGLKEFEEWAKVIFVAIAFSLLVLVYQIIIKGTTSYYFYKSLYTIFLLSSVFIGTFIALLVYSIVQYLQNNKLFANMLALIIVFGVSYVFIYNSKTGTLNTTLMDKSAYISKYKFDKAVAISQKHSNDPKPIIFIETGSALSDYVLSKWTTAINLNFNEDYGKKLDFNLNLSDQYRRNYKSENLNERDINLSDSGSAQIINFRNQNN